MVIWGLLGKSLLPALCACGGRRCGPFPPFPKAGRWPVVLPLDRSDGLARWVPRDESGGPWRTGSQGPVVARGQWWQHTRQGISCHPNSSNILDSSGVLLPFVSPPIPGFPLWGRRPSVRSRHQRRIPQPGHWPNSTPWVRLGTDLTRHKVSPAHGKSCPRSRVLAMAEYCGGQFLAVSRGTGLDQGNKQVATSHPGPSTMLVAELI